jgi:hypothetical protein
MRHKECYVVAIGAKTAAVQALRAVVQDRAVEILCMALGRGIYVPAGGGNTHS